MRNDQFPYMPKDLKQKLFKHEIPEQVCTRYKSKIKEEEINPFGDNANGVFPWNKAESRSNLTRNDSKVLPTSDKLSHTLYY